MRLFILIALLICKIPSSVAEISDTAKYNLNSDIIKANKLFVAQIPTLDVLNKQMVDSYQDSQSKIILTPEQQATVNYYKEHPLRVGLYTWDPYFIEDQGHYSGINYYFLSLLKSVFGIKVEITIDSFAGIKEKLERNEVDIVPGLFKSEIDKGGFLASAPYFLDMPSIYTKDMRLSNISLEALQNIRLGKRRQNGYFDQNDIDYLAKNNVHLNITNYDSDEDLINALKKGDTDYIIGSMSGIYLASGLYRIYLSESELGKLHYIGVSNKKENIRLLSLLNRFLTQDIIKNLNQYLEKFNQIRLKEGKFFTPEENALLAKHKNILVRTLVQSSYPDIAYDAVNNKLSGKVIYLFDRICRLLDINYTNNIANESISKTLSDLSSSRLNTVLGISDSLNRGGVISPTKVISHSDFYIVGYHNNINTYSDIFDADIGFISGQIRERYLENKFPSKKFKIYNSQDEAENALSSGEIHYLIVNEDLYNYFVYVKKHTSLKKNFKLDLSYHGVINFNNLRQGALYASIFSKSLEFINKDALIYDTSKFSNENIIKLITDNSTRKMQYMITPVLSLFLILFFICWFYLKKRKGQLRQLSNEYQDALLMTRSTLWSYNEFDDEIVIDAAMIELLSLEKLRLVNKRNQFVLKFNESMRPYFIDQTLFDRIKESFEAIRAGTVAQDQFEIAFAKGGNVNEIVYIMLTIRQKVIMKKNKIYGILHDMTPLYTDMTASK